MPPEDIPLNRPLFLEKGIEHMRAAFQNQHVSGCGPFTRRCEERLERQLGVARTLLTTSCTDALELSALLLDLAPGDEVIIPSFTFVSTANAFALRGARPVFADIRADTLNLDETKLAALVTPRTKAIVPVHYGGVACEMDAINALAAGHGLAVVEDNAHGLFGKYKGRWLGTLGAMATQSFHETKNITCGEGGALLINDPRYIGRAEVMREKGTNRARFFRGEVDKYSWVDLGSSFVMSDMLAAFLFAHLEVSSEIQAKRQALWSRYHRDLAGWTRARGIRQPVVPPHCEPAWHMYHLLLPTPASRTRLIAHLKARGVLAVFHYLPLHLSEYAARWGGRPGDCPVTEEVSERLVRLPFFNAMTDEMQDRVVAALLEFND